MLVLQVLQEADMYGYQLVKELENRSDKQLSMKEGTLYPALHKLEAKALSLPIGRSQNAAQGENITH